MAGIGSTNISFSGLRTAWGNASYAGGSDPGATNISLSEFYGATFTDGTRAPVSGEISINDFSGKTFGPIIYLNSSAISSGNKGTSVQTITFDLSGIAYVGSSVIGETGRIVFKYISGTNFTGDMQIVQVTTNGSSSNVGVDYTSWERNTTSNVTSYPDSNGWSTIGTSLIYGNWSMISGGTETDETGVAPSSTYGGVSLLFEASTNGVGFPNKTGFLRGPNTTFTSNSVTVHFYAYGATMGNLYAGVEIT